MLPSCCFVVAGHVGHHPRPARERTKLTNDQAFHQHSRIWPRPQVNLTQGRVFRANDQAATGARAVLDISRRGGYVSTQAERVLIQL
jgi:hypothetical protein